MRKFFFLSIAGALLLPSAALAQTAPDVREARVSYADLDITKAEGQEILDRRLVRAVRSVCAEDVSDPFAQLASYRCKVHTLRDARVQVTRAVAARQTRQILLAGR
ncbi:MAG TPA: UrcA family protein [Sphingomonas sp.]|nr:UrcA family protein [Sphingomonas sp.]